MNIPYIKTNSKATAPFRAHAGDAGADLCSTEEMILMPGERHAFGTGLALAIPKNHFGRVAPRSGLAVKQGIDVMAGVLDSQFRGEVKVCLVNLGQVPVNILAGQKIAQLIIERCELAAFEEVTALSDTERGAGGFGSTGS